MHFKLFILTIFVFVGCLGQEANPDVEVLPNIPQNGEPLMPAENDPLPAGNPAGDNNNIDINYETEKPDPQLTPDINPEVNTDVEPTNTNNNKTPSQTPTNNKLGRSGKYLSPLPADYDPMTSNIAPPDTDQRGGGTGEIPYIITEARLAQIRKPLMYPYYNKGGNADDEGDYQKTIQQSTSQVHKNLNFQLPFYGFRFNYTRVSINGYLEFSDPPTNYDKYPLSFPVKDWPKKNDPSFIGIFYSKCRIGNIPAEDVDQRTPGVYFRLERDLRTRSDRLGVEIRERLKWDIREGVVGSETFNPKHAIIVTWKNVSFNGGWANAVSVTNTFQMVLATDEVFTYAMFNYLNLQWTSHTEAGGTLEKGEGGTSAFVGFNAGNGTRAYEYKPYSQASVIRDLTATGMANHRGRHIFRIDEKIMLGTCNKDIDGANLPLVFAPESGNMLGGTVVNITGPCFKPTDQIRCVFDVGNTVYGVYVDSSRVICIQPQLYIEGYIDLEISIGSGTYKWKGKYYVENPASAAQKIFFRDESYRKKDPTEIRMTWEKYNLTTNENAAIRMSLWGYRETTIRPEFIYITDIDTNVQNTGEYTIIPANFRNRDNEFMDDMKFGFIQINLTEAIEVTSGSRSVNIVPVIWSRPIPLGWYFNFQWDRKYGSRWPSILCDEWLKNDRYLKNFAHELPQCPCSLEQALADKGRFLPDVECDKDTNRDCPYNDKAEHCVKTGSPTLEGAEQQCCYDKNGYLMMSYDQQWGSTPRRCHNLGYLPWNEATKVPTLSQWFHDVVPKYLCCLWQEEQAVGCETLRFERRPTQDCVAYQAPGIAGVYGDPHIITFDDYAYTFNGKGEFVLLKTYSKTNNLEIQGRFEQMPTNLYGEVRATQLTSVVARGNSSTIVEIRTRPKEARWRYRLDVIANGKLIYFDRPSLKFQHFPGVTVYTPTYIYNQSEVVVMFDNGAGLEVVENQGFMSARVYLPWTFINKTRGLFGNWSFIQEDDLSLPDGTKVQLATNINDYERLYKDFGMQWMLDDNVDTYKGRALFFREFGKTASSYNNKTFLPEFKMKPEDIIPQNRSTQVTTVYNMCSKDNYECFYDYAMTLDRDLAHFTSNYKASIYQLKETTKRKVVSCGVLETPRFGRKNTYLFIPGTKVTFECNTDFILVGDPRRTCLPDGRWDIPDYGYTECLRQQEYSQRQAGIAFGAVLVAIIPLVLLFAYVAYKYLQRRQKEKEQEELMDEQYQAQKKKAKLMATSKLQTTAGSDEFSDEDDDNSNVTSNVTSTVTPTKETAVY